MSANAIHWADGFYTHVGHRVHTLLDPSPSLYLSTLMELLNDIERDNQRAAKWHLCWSDVRAAMRLHDELEAKWHADIPAVLRGGIPKPPRTEPDEPPKNMTILGFPCEFHAMPRVVIVELVK